VAYAATSVSSGRARFVVIVLALGMGVRNSMIRRLAVRELQQWRGRWTVDRLHDALRDRVGDGAGRDPAVSPGIIDPQSVKAAGTVGFGSRGYDAGRTVNLRKGPRSESRPCPTPRFGSLSWDSSAAPAEAARVISRRR
jgi:hypothetical protein